MVAFPVGPLLPGLAGHPWAYPALEVVHILGVALLLGSLVVLELRVWSAPTVQPARSTLPAQPDPPGQTTHQATHPHESLPALARLALPVTLAGFALLAASGLLMFAANPAELLANRYFLIKLGLVGVAGLNAAVFHTRGGLARPDTVAKLQTLLSLGLWVAAIACGRWIAYA